MPSLVLDISVNDKGTFKVRAFKQEVASSRGALDGFDAGTRKASKGLDVFGVSTDRAWKQVRNFTASLLAASGIQSGVQGIVDQGKKLIETSMAFQRVDSTLLAITGSTAAAKNEFKYVSDEAMRLGLNLTTAAGSYAQIAAAAKGTALEGKGVRDIFSAVSEASTVLGLSTDRTELSLFALQQMMSKQRISSEELVRQLGDNLPGTLAMASRAMGVSTQELMKMMKAGELYADDFLPRFAEELRKTYSGALPSAVQNANAQVGMFETTLSMVRAKLADSGPTDAFVNGMNEIRESMAAALADGEELEAWGKRIGGVIEGAFGAAQTGMKVGGAVGPLIEPVAVVGAIALMNKLTLAVKAKTMAVVDDIRVNHEMDVVLAEIARRDRDRAESLAMVTAQQEKSAAAAFSKVEAEKMASTAAFNTAKADVASAEAKMFAAQASKNLATMYLAEAESKLASMIATQKMMQSEAAHLALVAKFATSPFSKGEAERDLGVLSAQQQASKGAVDSVTSQVTAARQRLVAVTAEVTATTNAYTAADTRLGQALAADVAAMNAATGARMRMNTTNLAASTALSALTLKQATYSAALKASSLAGQLWTSTTKAMGAAMAFVGGPIGVAIIALYSYKKVMDSVSESTKKARQETDDFNQRLLADAQKYRTDPKTGKAFMESADVTEQKALLKDMVDAKHQLDAAKEDLAGIAFRLNDKSFAQYFKYGLGIGIIGDYRALEAAQKRVAESTVAAGVASDKYKIKLQELADTHKKVSGSAKEMSDDTRKAIDEMTSSLQDNLTKLQMKLSGHEDLIPYFEMTNKIDAAIKKAEESGDKVGANALRAMAPQLMALTKEEQNLTKAIDGRKAAEKADSYTNLAPFENMLSNLQSQAEILDRINGLKVQAGVLSDAELQRQSTEMQRKQLEAELAKAQFAAANGPGGNGAKNDLEREKALQDIYNLKSKIVALDEESSWQKVIENQRIEVALTNDRLAQMQSEMDLMGQKRGILVQLGQLNPVEALMQEIAAQDSLNQKKLMALQYDQDRTMDLAKWLELDGQILDLEKLIADEELKGLRIQQEQQALLDSLGLRQTENAQRHLDDLMSIRGEIEGNTDAMRAWGIEVAKTQSELDRLSGSFSRGLSAGLRDYITEASDKAAMGAKLAADAAHGMENAFTTAFQAMQRDGASFADGAKIWAKSFLQTMIDALNQVIAKQLTMMAIQAAMGMVGGGMGGFTFMKTNFTNPGLLDLPTLPASMPSRSTSAPAPKGTVVNIIDQRTNGGDIQTRSTTGSDGTEILEVMIDDRIQKSLNGGHGSRILKHRFGLQEQGVIR
jgi:tape measure domain-containing protein